MMNKSRFGYNPARQNALRNNRFGSRRQPPARNNVPTSTSIFSNRGAQPEARRADRPPLAETSARQNVQADPSIFLSPPSMSREVFDSWRWLDKKCRETFAENCVTSVLPTLQILNNITNNTGTDTARDQNSEIPQRQPGARRFLGLSTQGTLQTLIDNLKLSVERLHVMGTTMANQREGNSNQQNRPESRPLRQDPPAPQAPPPPSFRLSPAPSTYHRNQALLAGARHTSPLLPPPMGGASTSRASQPARDEQGTPPHPYRNPRWHRPEYRRHTQRFDPYYQRHHH